jgi:hypothetical protein
MNCRENNISSAMWEILKSIPGIRYLKAPVDTVSQLYEKYPDGVERGAFAFVLDTSLFYVFRNGEWVPAGDETAVADVMALLTAETEARSNADEVLQTAIENADEVLQTAIENEERERQESDGNIQNSFAVLNVSPKITSGSGYEPAIARAGVPVGVRKKGLVITYRTPLAGWRIEQFFQGELAEWTNDANWRAVGADLSGIEDDIVVINNQISVLQKTAFKHLSIGSIADLDEITDPGAYYIGTQEIPDGEQGPALYSKDFLFVAAAGSAILGKVNDATQYRINRDGLSMRKHYTAEVTVDGPSKPAYWDEWEYYNILSTAAIEEAVDSYLQDTGFELSTESI